MTTAAQIRQALSEEKTWRDPRAFVEPEVWEREIKLLVRDNPFDTVMAERLFSQAIAYLITAMEKHGQQLEIGCGELVDAAVHAFILDTRNYREFCHRYFDGKFLEHIPEIERKYDGSVQRTAEVIQANGFQVDWPLWEKDFSKCTPATRAVTATDRPPGGAGAARFRPLPRSRKGAREEPPHDHAGWAVA